MPASIQPGDPEQVRDLFDRIAPAYDTLNDLLSLGLHRIWKRQAVAWLQPHAGQCLLDLCCGTGDLALVLAEKVRPAGLVLGIDAAAAPLERARERARSSGAAAASKPSTSPPGRTFSASSRARSPVPQQRSSKRSPGRGASQAKAWRFQIRCRPRLSRSLKRS